MKENWKSPRALQAEADKATHDYHQERFEYWMSEVDKGHMTREEAIEANRNERLAEAALDGIITRPHFQP